MGQIVKRKKKGRPSKADLARRNAAESPHHEPSEPERDLRRSLRRRNVKYIFDFDDFIDDEEEFEDERGREKKLKLLLSLHSQEGGHDDDESTPGRTVGVGYAPNVSPSSSDQCKQEGMNGKVDGDYEFDVAEDDENDNGNEIYDNVYEDEVGGRKAEQIGVDSAPGTPTDPSSGHPFPDKKSVELILDKLQKKDIYGVYAEPVDPEELPDYHDVIKHPMDFTTVRKKLANGTYLTLEQFESDVFLICTNAMQYNSPDTIYHKQARSIQELAKRKLGKLRVDIERSDKDIKLEQKPKSHSLVKKQLRKPVSRIVHEPIGSDFSSGATLATLGDLQNVPNAVQVRGLERPGSIDGLVEGNSSFIVCNGDKSEELQQGKSLSRFGKKPLVHEENRRDTYNLPSLPVAYEESIFTTFAGESKNLVPVGLYADHSYARSLARFAATLGPAAWRVASKRIEQALPAGFKFGHGWVGEYEPLPTAVLMLEQYTLRDPISSTKIEHIADAKRDDETCCRPASADLPGNASLFEASTTGACMPLHAREQTSRIASLERTHFICSGSKSTSSNSQFQLQSSISKSHVESEEKVLKQVEMNLPPSMNQKKATYVADRHLSNGPEISAAPRSAEMVLGNRNSSPSAVFKQSNSNGIANEELPNGKVVNSGLNNNGIVSFSSAGIPNQMARVAMCFPHGQEQAPVDPVQLMKMMAEQAQNQHKPSNSFPVDSLPPQSGSSPRRDDSNNAAAAAARAWMSIGAGGSKPTTENTGTSKSQISADSLYNPTRGFQPQVSRFRGELPVSGMHMQQDRNGYQFNAFVPQNDRMASVAQIQNQHMVFPRLSTADLSRFQLQSPWHNLSPQMQQQRQPDSLPPDLNIGFQSSGSPVRQSSGVLVDSQQPDLALQL